MKKCPPLEKSMHTSLDINPLGPPSCFELVKKVQTLLQTQKLRLKGTLVLFQSDVTVRAYIIEAFFHKGFTINS
jgi:hypothetical protein